MKYEEMLFLQEDVLLAHSIKIIELCQERKLHFSNKTNYNCSLSLQSLNPKIFMKLPMIRYYVKLSTQERERENKLNRLCLSLFRDLPPPLHLIPSNI